MKPYSSKSKYGQYYKNFNKDEKICIFCTDDTICGKIVQSKNYSTNGMREHLRSHGVSESAIISKNDTLINNRQKISKFAKTIFERTDSTFTIARLICCEMISINSLASSIAMKTLFDKAFGIELTRYYIWNAVQKVHEIMVDHIKEQMEDKKITVTIDDWTSRQSIGFCNINASYVQNNTLVNHCLGLIRLHKTDGLNLSTKVKERFSAFNILPKFITTDGASNMITMSRHGGFLQQKCLVHGIQLVVFDLIFSKKNKITELPELEFDNCEDDSEISESQTSDSEALLNDESDDSDFKNCCEQSIEIFDYNGKIKHENLLLIKKVRSIMVFLKRSTKQRELFKKYTKLSHIIDVCTRWNSTLSMLKRFLRLHVPLQKASLDSQEIAKKAKFSATDILIIQNIVKILIPFDDATRNLSKAGTNIHMADIILQMMVSKIDNENLKEQALNKIKQRREIWSDVLLFLKNDFKSICFYTEPTDSQIIDLYNKVIKLFI